MKVLITGEKSYAGTQFAKRIEELQNDWCIDFISVRGSLWEEKDFSTYDAIYHVAAVVHKKELPNNDHIYYKVNRDLTYQLALKARSEGVKCFVFLSTIAVYGLIGEIGKDTIISKNTKTFPNSHYGKSKLEAEELITTLGNPDFNVSVLRIPMIYGPKCPGNYGSLSKLVKKIPFFPKVDNKRSMIFVDNLSDIVIYIIENSINGILLIKNQDDVNTLNMVNEICKSHNKTIYNSVFLGFLIRRIGNKHTITRKMFSSIYYKDSESNIAGFEFEKISFEETISKTEIFN